MQKFVPWINHFTLEQLLKSQIQLSDLFQQTNKKHLNNRLLVYTSLVKDRHQEVDREKQDN